MSYTISAIAVKSYNRALLEAAIRRHFAELNIAEKLNPAMRVLLKPNLLMKRTPEEGTTTHPELVRAVAVVLKEHGINDITIADSPSGPYQKKPLEAIYAATGMARVASETGAKLALSTGWETVPNTVPNSLCKEFNIISPVRQADFIINLPKLKTHVLTALSGGVKNLFGCVPGLQKPEMHLRFPDSERFGRMLLELAGCVCPALTIADAVVSMEGDGPSAGSLRQTGWTLAAENIYALDMALCQLIGIAPEQVQTVRLAVLEGNSPREYKELTYVGDGQPPPVTDYRIPATGLVRGAGMLLPSFLSRPFRRAAMWFAPRPVICSQSCIGCGKCAESCPAKVIELVHSKAKIDYNGCIRCFCCHEMCPVRAVEIR